MDWQPLESKMFASAAYDADKRILYLRFRSGDVHRYFEFKSADYKAFLGAESRGLFLYERMAKSRAAWSGQDR